MPSIPLTVAVLSFACLASGRAQGLATPVPARPSGVLPLDEVFQQLDTNKDGRISKAEAVGPIGQRFPQWDANQDGFATRKEIHDYRLKYGIDDAGLRVPPLPGKPQPGVPAGGKPAAVATILKDPAAWRLEALPMPPTFAPDIVWKGAEEIRFAPGMFDPATPNYFTCLIALALEGAPEIGPAEVKDFLQKYYRGLASSRASRSGTPLDLSEIRATLAPSATPGGPYEAGVLLLDPFNNGRKTALNVETSVFRRLGLQKTFLLLAVSPAEQESEPWQALRAAVEKAKLNLPAP